MGPNTKEKGPAYECTECERKFQTITALKIHSTVKHPLVTLDTYRATEHEQNDSKSLEGNDVNESVSKEEKKTALVPPTSRASKRIQEMKSTKTETVDKDTDLSASDKTVFACPKCEKVFQIYFTASKHIQKRHCVDADGNPVPPDVLKLIKPIRKEKCSICSKAKLSEDFNCCEDLSSTEVQIVKASYHCLGCRRNFVSISTFDNHIAASHCDDIDTMIFDTFNEFLVWKSDLEKQVLVKYRSLTNITSQTQFYHCSYTSPRNTAQVTHLCPSVLVAKHFSKTIQINFYKTHHEHSCEYKMPTQFESYILSGTIKQSVDSRRNNDYIYVKFKNLMKGILNTAAMVNVNKLKKLYSLAEEMDSCLKNQDSLKNAVDMPAVIKEIYALEDIDVSTETVQEDEPIEKCAKNLTDKENSTSKSMNDEQITEVLEQPRTSARLKRKSESSESVLKKEKQKVDTTETKAGLKESNATTEDAKSESPKTRTKGTSSESPSFNDSYKKFIDNNRKVKSSISTRRAAKRVAIKTRMGRFSQRKAAQDTAENVNTARKKRSLSVNSPKAPVVVNEDATNVIQSPKRAAETAESDNFDSIVKKKRRDSVASPKASKRRKDSVSSPGTSIANINLEDIEYEVLEQENDCNILVLKI